MAESVDRKQTQEDAGPPIEVRSPRLRVAAPPLAPRLQHSNPRELWLLVIVAVLALAGMAQLSGAPAFISVMRSGRAQSGRMVLPGLRGFSHPFLVADLDSGEWLARFALPPECLGTSLFVAGSGRFFAVDAFLKERNAGNFQHELLVYDARDLSSNANDAATSRNASDR